MNVLPFVLAMMLAASANFLTPMGDQTNLIFYGLGGYGGERFMDFARVRLPLSVIFALGTL